MDTKCPNTSDTSKQSTRIEKFPWVLPLMLNEKFRWATLDIQVSIRWLQENSGVTATGFLF